MKKKAKQPYPMKKHEPPVQDKSRTPKGSKSKMKKKGSY